MESAHTPRPAATPVTLTADDRTRRWRGTVLEGIGNTPLIQVNGIWVKLEYLNPSGSIKARIAAYMIERAETEGLLRTGDTIVEASSGNTGNAMSMVAAAKGYRMLVFMPIGMSRERAAISRAFGAEVVTVGEFHVNEALEQAREYGERPGYFAPQQFDSEWNVDENQTWLGPEILRQLPEGVVPEALVERNRELIDDVVSVKGEDAIAEMRRLAREHGLFVGPSSGAHLVAARQYQQAHPELEHVVTALCDQGEKYISDYFI